MWRHQDFLNTNSESPQKMLSDDMLRFVSVYDARFADALAEIHGPKSISAKPKTGPERYEQSGIRPDHIKFETSGYGPDLPGGPWIPEWRGSCFWVKKLLRSICFELYAHPDVISRISPPVCQYMYQKDAKIAYRRLGIISTDKLSEKKLFDFYNSYWTTLLSICSDDSGG